MQHGFLHKSSAYFSCSSQFTVKTILLYVFMGIVFQTAPSSVEIEC